jgi:Mor family transcriptional regulator
LIDKDEIKERLQSLTPAIKELPGDLPLLAKIIEKYLPGKGVEVVLEIVGEFRGTYLYCPTIDKLEKAARNRLLLELYEQGARVPELARAVVLTERQVWNILGKEPVDDRQGRLF